MADSFFHESAISIIPYCASARQVLFLLLTSGSFSSGSTTTVFSAEVEL
jgi:hypothetical protein